MLLGEGWGAVHEDQQLDDALDFVQVAGGGLQCCEQIDGYAPRRLLPFRGGQVGAQFAGPGVAVFLCYVAGDEEEVAGSFVATLKFTAVVLAPQRRTPTRSSGSGL